MSDTHDHRETIGPDAGPSQIEPSQLEPSLSGPAESGAGSYDLPALHDLISRHFDGALDPDGQRALARQLAASHEARRTLAGYLRLEAALVRLGLARQLGPPGAQAMALPTSREAASEATAVLPRDSTTVAGTRRAWHLPMTSLAIAGALLVALSIAPRMMRWQDTAPGRSDTHAMDRVAEHWLQVARDSAPRGADEVAFAADAAGGDELSDEPGDQLGEQVGEQPDAGPPAWLVAAMADEEFQRLSPDAG